MYKEMATAYLDAYPNGYLKQKIIMMKSGKLQLSKLKNLWNSINPK